MTGPDAYQDPVPVDDANDPVYRVVEAAFLPFGETE